VSGSRARLALLAPAAVLLFVVVVLPIARVIELSFLRVDLDGGLLLRFAGFDSYLRLWRDERWWTSLSNTAIFTVSSTLLSTLAGVAVALLLHRKFQGRGFVRAATLLPWALPTAVMALAWVWIFNDSFGVANDLLWRLGFADRPIAWLGRPGTAMAALVIADVWKTMPFVALVVLAGLQGVPEQVLEAARVDGLSSWARIRHLVLPLVAPSIALAAAFRALQCYAAFDIVYVMTGGGPGGSTETVSLYSFQSYFRYLDFGYGSAIATQGALLVAALVFLIGTWRRRGEAA
jgi:multiple sugar transport system permease protein